MLEFLEGKSEEFRVKLMLLIDSGICKHCQVQMILTLLCATAQLVYHTTRDKEKSIESIHELTSMAISNFLQDGDKVEEELIKLMNKIKPQTSNEVADLISNFIENDGKIH